MDKKETRNRQETLDQIMSVCDTLEDVFKCAELNNFRVIPTRGPGEWGVKVITTRKDFAAVKNYFSDFLDLSNAKTYILPFGATTGYRFEKK